MGAMRLDKFLEKTLQESRSGVKKELKKGIISVNGEPELHPERKIDPDVDRVSAGGRPLIWEKSVWLMLHKPGGCVTAAEDAGHRTVMDYIDHPRRAELFPVGRLDLDTEGLLFLTNEGATAHRMLSPSHHVEKTYFVRVRGELTDADVRAFAEGIDIGEKKKTLPAELRILRSGADMADEARDADCPSGKVTEAEVTICEGKFHQIKRMFARQGCEVVYLKRIRMAGITLDEKLAPGRWRELTKEETERLHTYAETGGSSDF